MIEYPNALLRFAMHKILTHAIFHNIGGLLQAYALQQAMKKLGRKCCTIDYLQRDWCGWMSAQGPRAKLRYWCTLIRMLAGSRKEWTPRYLLPSLARPFKSRFLNLWKLDNRRKRFPKLADGSPFVVGSDQVWRAVYAREMETVPFFFLNFATKDQRKLSIAYAASFGSDEWEGTPEETEECARLLKDFKAVSVREHSGIRICREIFGVDAVQMPDPTLLLEAADYSRVIRRWWTRRLPKPFMAVYLLDETAEKRALTQAVAGSANLYPQQLTAHGDAARAMDRIPLSVPQWLRCMRDCECVLTDSFHGCVFAIIFNKPFVCLGNAGRGSARFDSLLSTFGLQDRLLTNPTPEQAVECMRTPIDWERVNAIRRSEQQRAFEFLKLHLEKN